MTAPQQTADDFLMGGGAKSAKFETIGTLVGGVITAEPTMQQQKDIETQKPKFWDNGDPMMQMVVKVQTNLREAGDTDDDGVRAFYIKGQMRDAVRDAVKAAGQKGLHVGGTLEIVYAGDGVAKNKGFTAPKQYQARYTPPAVGSDFFGGTPAAAAPATAPHDPWTQQAPAAPAPAPVAVAAPAESRLVTLPDGSQVTPEVAALLQQVQAGASA
jgi:hypothetical protein